MTYCLLDYALRHLRIHLDQRPINSPDGYQYLFRVLAYLMTADGFASAFGAAQIHIDTAVTLIQCMGGVSGIQCTKTRDMLIKIIVSIHSFTLKVCKVDLQDCFLPDQQLSTTEAALFVQYYGHTREVPKAFQPFLSGKQDCPVLSRVIRSVASCSAVLDSLTKINPGEAVTTEVARWVYYSDITIRHELLNLKSTSDKVDCLRLGLLLWVTATLTSLGPTPIAAAMSQNLQEHLNGRCFADWALTPKSGLWVSSLGAIFAADNSDTET